MPSFPILLVELIKAIPVLDALIRRLIVWYCDYEYEQYKKDITAAIQSNDQRNIEAALGSVFANRPSGDLAAELRESKTKK